MRSIPPPVSRFASPAEGIPAYRNLTNEDFDRCRRAIERKHEFVSRLHQDGVTVLLGTDTQQPFVAPATATANATAVLGLTKVGTIAEGGRAELIASRTDPRQSGWSVERDLVATIARGVLVTAADVDEAIRAELGRFENKFSEFATRLLAQLNMRQVAKKFVG